MGTTQFFVTGISKLFAISFATGLLGLIIWFILRIKQKRIWIPTLRVMVLERNNLPRFRLSLPPFLPFLCFFLCCGALIFFSARPTRQTIVPFDPEKSRVHLLLDYSPSVSAHLTPAEYSSKVASLWTSFGSSVRRTLSTTHSKIMHEPKTDAELRTLLDGLNFHRNGILLGAALKRQLEDLGDIDRLLIFSDQDANSWNDFNWQYLSEHMEVLFIDLSSGKRPGPNTFINNVQFTATPDAPIYEWNVDIARRDETKTATGVLMLKVGETAIAEEPWTMQAGRERIVLRVAAAQSKLAEAQIATQAESLAWELTLESTDSIVADNLFRSPVAAFGGNKVWIVADPRGEAVLEDPAYYLRVSLEVLGFKIQRSDWIDGALPMQAGFPLWVLVQGEERRVLQSCTIGLGANVSKAGSKPRVWLVPETTDVGFGSICACYAHLVLDQPLTATQTASYCKEVNSREALNELLPAVGAGQIGGQVGKKDETLAWIGVNEHNGLEVVAFTIPLKPSRFTGVSHARLPILVRSILEWQALLTRENRLLEEWPRIIDPTHEDFWSDPGTDAKSAATARTSNVPRGESLLSQAPAKLFPPGWSPSVAKTVHGHPVRKDESDPLPWIKLCAGLVFFAFVLEALALLFRFQRRPEKKGKGILHHIAPMIFIFFAAWGCPEAATAKITINAIAPGAGRFQLTQLAKEITSRTSLEFSDEVLAAETFAKNALEEPWLWVTSLNSITTSDATLKTDVVRWIERGGFLVIEALGSDQDLDMLIQKSFPKHGQASSLVVIPPDHELMRSFYLLDALPSCGTNPWKGFMFDRRLAIIVVPFNFLEQLRNFEKGAAAKSCPGLAAETSVRTFVNILMVALTTDYKKDQIHMREILKRLQG